ncbi:MAG: hypothetical protein KUG64_10405 [Cycloclasticus sp.]|nr:hypothetical protein [Cycloclasticus sp.]
MSEYKFKVGDYVRIVPIRMADVIDNLKGGHYNYNITKARTAHRELVDYCKANNVSHVLGKIVVVEPEEFDALRYRVQHSVELWGWFAEVNLQTDARNQLKLEVEV